MHIEYEEFETIEDIFMYMSSVAPPMKNALPIHLLTMDLPKLNNWGSTSLSHTWNRIRAIYLFYFVFI